MSIAAWFYSDSTRQQQGPVDEDGLAQLWREGRINAQTLVWREGQGAWLALGELAAAMPWQRTMSANQPPLPPPMGSARPPAAPVLVAQPAKKGMGCLVIGIIVAVVSIPVLGILAAIAIPAYADYTERARIAELIIVATPLKARLAETYARDQACPEGHDLATTEHNPKFSSAWFGTFDSGHCGIELTIADQTNLQKFAGKKLWFWREGTDTTWKCSSDIDNRYLPVACRG